MSETTDVTAREIRRRRLAFRSWHRGTREADLLLGRFADRHLADFSDAQLDRYERLLQENDPDIYGWLTGRAPVPDEHDHDVIALLKAFTMSGSANGLPRPTF